MELKNNENQWYHVSESAFKSYQNHFNNNKEEDRMTAYKKINRNIRAGQLIRQQGNGIDVIGYGFMRIGLRDNTVVFIDNHVKPAVPIDKELKEKLNIKWGITKAEVIQEDNIDTYINKEEEIEPQYEGVSMIFKLKKFLHIGA